MTEEQIRLLTGLYVGPDVPIHVDELNASAWPRVVHAHAKPRIAVGKQWLSRFERGKISWRACVREAAGVSMHATGIPIVVFDVLRGFSPSRPQLTLLGVVVEASWIQKHLPQCWPSFLNDLLTGRVTIRRQAGPGR